MDWTFSLEWPRGDSRIYSEWNSGMIDSKTYLMDTIWNRDIDKKEEERNKEKDEFQK